MINNVLNNGAEKSNDWAEGQREKPLPEKEAEKSLKGRCNTKGQISKGEGNGWEHKLNFTGIL